MRRQILLLQNLMLLYIKGNYDKHFVCIYSCFRGYNNKITFINKAIDI